MRLLRAFVCSRGEKTIRIDYVCALSYVVFRILLSAGSLEPLHEVSYKSPRTPIQLNQNSAAYLQVTKVIAQRVFFFTRYVSYACFIVGSV
jgi:hypothetical protein